MISAARTRAESHFTVVEKRQQKVLSEQEEAVRATDENTARLKALRLAKEAKDRAKKVDKGISKRAGSRSAS